MKKIYLYLLLPFFLIILTGCSKNTPENNSTNVTSKRIAVSLNSKNDNTIDNYVSPNVLDNTIENSNLPIEIELGSFSTKILTSDPNRNNNIRLTCERLNGHIIKSAETFSFTGLLGKSTSDKGYKSANVINSEGDTIKGLGGGNCQVSSTLYNAVAMVPELEIIERHNHGAEVYYVPIGQDAAVAYGSMDFKFKNNSSDTIKIYISTDDKNINARVCKIKN